MNKNENSNDIPGLKYYLPDFQNQQLLDMMKTPDHQRLETYLMCFIHGLITSEVWIAELCA